MEINSRLVDTLASLSRLHFDEREKEEIRADLEKMIGFVDKLNELDLSDTQPLLHIIESGSQLREDEPGEMLKREEALKNAAMANEEFFRVPKVIKK